MGKMRSPFTFTPKCTCTFKKRGAWKAGYHTGEDWICNEHTLVAPIDGKVVANKYDKSGYGYYIIINSGDMVVLMAHMKSRSPIKAGASVAAGQPVGMMGSTGNSTGAHLHIEVQRAKSWAYNANLIKPSEIIDFYDFNNKKESFNVKRYKNGSTNEYVFSTVADCKAQNKNKSIGMLFAGEICDCYGTVNECYLVVYNASGSKKTGFVKYPGGVAFE